MIREAAHPDRGHPSWSALSARAKTWRLVHAAWSVAQLTCLAYVWASVIARRRDPALWACTAFLATEGGALIIGRGNCPVGALQAEWGDPVPFFELVLPPRAAKAAVPALAVVAGAGLVALAVIPPRLAVRSPGRGRGTIRHRAAP